MGAEKVILKTFSDSVMQSVKGDDALKTKQVLDRIDKAIEFDEINDMVEQKLFDNAKNTKNVNDIGDIYGVEDQQILNRVAERSNAVYNNEDDKTFISEVFNIKDKDDDSKTIADVMIENGEVDAASVFDNSNNSDNSGDNDSSNEDVIEFDNKDKEESDKIIDFDIKDEVGLNKVVKDENEDTKDDVESSIENYANNDVENGVVNDEPVCDEQAVNINVEPSRY